MCFKLSKKILYKTTSYLFYCKKCKNCFSWSVLVGATLCSSKFWYSNTVLGSVHKYTFYNLWQKPITNGPLSLVLQLSKNVYIALVWNLTLKSDVLPTNAPTMFSSTKVATFSIRDTTGQVKTFHGDRMRHEQHPGTVETPVLAHDTRTFNFQQD